MAMWQMHRPWARRTVAPEGGQTPFPLGFAPGPPHYWPRYFLLSQLARPFALPRPDALSPLSHARALQPPETPFYRCLNATPRPFFLSTGNLAHLEDAVASLRWHDAGR